MQVLFWIIMIFLVLMFMVSLSNCMDRNALNRGVEVLISVVVFAMIVALIIVKYNYIGG